LARTGWFTKVHIRSEASDRVRALVAARERLIRMRKDLEAHIRGVLKTFGITQGAVGCGGFIVVDSIRPVSRSSRIGQRSDFRIARSGIIRSPVPITSDQ
jgi:hypothetical protein